MTTLHDLLSAAEDLQSASDAIDWMIETQLVLEAEVGVCLLDLSMLRQQLAGAIAASQVV